MSSRMGDMGLKNGGSSASKVFLPLAQDLSVLQLTIRNLVASDSLRGIVVLTKAGDEGEAGALLEKEAPYLQRFVGVGGSTRQQSVYAGLKLLDGKAKFVLVHDGARPFCPERMIAKVAEMARRTGAAILATPVKQSIKQVSSGEVISRSLPRSEIWEAQTPQAFRYDLLREAHEKALAENYEATDDSELVERLGTKVHIVSGSDKNIKITTPVDLELAQQLLKGFLDAEDLETFG